MSACTHDHWHTLWAAFHATRGTTLKVSREALADVGQCNGGIPKDLLAIEPKRKSATVTVRRPELFLFLRDHGWVCPGV